ncbi:MAG: S9 family peptidase [Bacteroidetes bacterium]|nr:S9 family peptidase [Bacteroidota bacterium]
MKGNFPRTRFIFTTLTLLFTLGALAQGPLTAFDLLTLKSADNLQISPDGTEVIYSVSTPRGPNEEPGSSHTTYLRMKIKNGTPTPLFGEGIEGSSPQFSPDGKLIGFLRAGEEESNQVWYMNVSGGEISKLTDAPGGVSYFRWQPGKNGIAYLSQTPVSEMEKELNERGYGFIFYEENLKNSNLFLAEYDDNLNQTGVIQLTSGAQAWDFEFDRQGTMIAASISPKNLIDQKYMFRRIYLVNPETGERNQVSKNEGKLGNYQFSPDGTRLAYAAALNLNDHSVSQAFVVEISSGKVINLTPGSFRGHISWVNWKDDKHLLYYSEEGVYPKLSTVPVKGGKRKTLLDAAKSGIIFSTPNFDKDITQFVFTGSSPGEKANLYSWDGKGELQELTNLNPQLKQKALGKQEVIRYKARDGVEIEGIVIHPVGYESGLKYPLVVYVHGGPESHHSNGWLSRYSTPGQVMAGKGYLVLHLNYRASTGYGVPFGMVGFEDPAGIEFDDIADGIDWMVETKGADRERVGMAGGSYGGYASGWFATYYTKYVKAVCMFVGISNRISKRGTTDISYEELYVHSGKPLEEMWQLDLERSPIYWAHQSKTATLIYGGAADTRVHPSQSFELHRRMKMNNHPAVRLVQYPGEGHGNRMQVGQIDVIYRQMEWLDWYVRDLKPLDGPMPRLDISDRYGLDWQH